MRTMKVLVMRLMNVREWAWYYHRGHHVCGWYDMNECLVVSLNNLHHVHCCAHDEDLEMFIVRMLYMKMHCCMRHNPLSGQSTECIPLHMQTVWFLERREICETDFVSFGLNVGVVCDHPSVPKQLFLKLQNTLFFEDIEESCSATVQATYFNWNEFWKLAA